MTIVTVLTGHNERVRRDISAEQSRRREAVGLLIQRLEKVARVQNRPIFGRVWARPELEFLLAIPHLNLMLTDEEQPISDWLSLQVRLMYREPTNELAAIKGVEAAAVLSKWYRGKKQIPWFQEQLAPYENEDLPPTRRTWQRDGHATGEAAGAAVVLVASTVGTLFALTKAQNAVLRFWNGRRKIHR